MNIQLIKFSTLTFTSNQCSGNNLSFTSEETIEQSCGVTKKKSQNKEQKYFCAIITYFAFLQLPELGLLFFSIVLLLCLACFHCGELCTLIFSLLLPCLCPLPIVHHVCSPSLHMHTFLLCFMALADLHCTSTSHYVTLQHISGNKE